jgi:ubiquinone/menaquinone biosynthesis C-methylase UbiE
MAGHNPASCCVKNTPIPQIFLTSYNSMKNIYKHSFLLQIFFYRLSGFITKNINNYLHFYHKQRPSQNIENISEYFETSEGTRMPVYENYRYAVKPGWKYFSSLSSLHWLIKRDLASLIEKEFFHKAKGTRTLTKSLSEIEAVAKKAVSRNKKLFLPESLEPIFQPQLIPSQNDILRKIAHHKKDHQVLFSKLKSFGVDTKIHMPGKLLEIGYISGGFSIFAFEKLGFEAYGIDNFYGNETRKSPLSGYIKKKTGSSVRFILGDITRKTDFNDNELDVIYSASVLEHINNLAEAFEEMHRILKPGGLIIHGYNPFFCPNGGHALGITDCPWGHVRMQRKDYLRYMEELRPHEVDIAKEWINSSLNGVSIRGIQSHIARRGFQILFWQQHAAPPEHQADLTPEIMAACFQNHPHISLDDLITSTVTFAARKN